MEIINVFVQNLVESYKLINQQYHKPFLVKPTNVLMKNKDTISQTKPQNVFPILENIL